ncbi:MAG: hypothetical protein JWO58_1935 [Chitinophagaceae bacterium]|nr:hypothetical protein [Chitinophagaceae bacterium]
MRRYLLLSVCAVALVIYIGGISMGEKKIRKDRVPTTVKAYIEKEFQGAQRIKYYIESDQDSIIYEAEFVYKKERISLLFLSDGTLYEMEKRIALEDLPAATQEKIESYLKRTYRKYKINEIQFVNPHLKTEYELNVKAKTDSGTSFYEINFNEKGELITSKELIVKPIQTLF